MKDCPACKLVNPDTAQRCDCGYDFPTGTMQQSYVSRKDRRLKASGAVGAVLILIMLMRLPSLLNEARKGTDMFVWGIGLVLLFAATFIYWPRRSSRDDSK
jgi:hypothetical protein